MQATPAKSIGNEQDSFPMAPVSGRLTTDGSDVDSPANHATVFTH